MVYLPTTETEAFPMAKNNYYAVRCGRQTGIFRTWAECQQQVNGFPHACFQGFATLTEAEAFLNSPADSVKEEAPDGGSSSNKSQAEQHFPSVAPETALAYVDGSYDQQSGDFACGVVLLLSDGEQHFQQRFHDPDLSAMRNVAGEIKGAELAMQLALDLNLKHLTIFHDYQGISSWCIGDWKTNLPGTRAYRDYYLQAADKIQIRFVKVKGHSGDHYNDLADRLARSALNK